jgi:hypothetical protein
MPTRTGGVTVSSVHTRWPFGVSKCVELLQVERCENLLERLGPAVGRRRPSITSSGRTRTASLATVFLRGGGCRTALASSSSRVSTQC